MNEIEIFVCEPNNKQYFMNVENSLDALQQVVGGNLEKIHIPYLAQQNMWLMADEMGGLKGKEPSLWVDTVWIVGTCFFVKERYNKFASFGKKDKEMLAKYMSGDPSTSSLPFLFESQQRQVK